MENRILILLMSCNQPLYEEEELACRDTFLKTADELGVPYYIYKGNYHPGGTDDQQVIDRERHMMNLNCPDNLAGTSLKTLLALAKALEDDDWDYLVKTNVSTWLDVGRILDAVGQWEGRDDRNVYGARWIANEASKRIPFPRGHFTILPRSMVEGIVKWTPKLIGAEGFPRTDDTLIGLAALYHTEKCLGNRYLDSMRLVPSVTSWSDDICSSPQWDSALSVRCKDEKDMEETPAHMRLVDRLKRSGAGTTYRSAPDIFETPYGNLSYGNYALLSKALDEKRARESGNTENS